MKILSTTAEIQAYTKEMKAQGKTIGLVPTMGALHEGHLTLMRRARKENDIVIVSDFVNPTQFGPNEDFDKYPRVFDADCEKMETVPVDAVFHPEPSEMYPDGYCTYVNVEGDITHKLCGAQRPGHFRGVATVVTKLMNLSRADRAYFGQKDAQQVVVVKRFVADLNINVEIVMVPISREESGLARSSRNRYMSDAEKEAALVLSRSLRKGEAAYEGGEKNVEAIKKIVSDEIKKEKLATIDYVDVYSFPELLPIETINEPTLLAIAVKIGKTRLIDNVIIGGDTK
ncbi:MAG: pantoate--beta-alanine ligase [Schwartzia sp.]|nr:pantoate--beta-alanine ligase [Schwartzia sp. (in: firmicutes)]